MKERCENCRYFAEIAWECRRRVPQVVAISSWSKDDNKYLMVQESFFPEVSSNTWCGEFEPKEDEK